MGLSARIQEIHAVIRGKRPVVVFTGAVDTVERFFVKQAFQPVLSRHSLECLHDKLVIIRRHIGLGIDESQLVLSRSHLIMLRLRRHAHTPELDVHVFHEGGNTRLNDTIIVIIQFLSLGRHRAEKRAPCIDQVFPLQIFFRIDDKILLLRADAGHNLL